MDNQFQVCRNKFPLNLFTIIQAYLPTNFVFVLLALVSKRVRKHLYQCGLRKDRELQISISNQERQELSLESVSRMVQFSDQIVISIKSTLKTNTVLSRSLNQLSSHLSQIMLNQESEEIQISILSNIQEIFFKNYLCENFSKLNSFYQLMQLANGFKKVVLSNLDLEKLKITLYGPRLKEKPNQNTYFQEKVYLIPENARKARNKIKELNIRNSYLYDLKFLYKPFALKKLRILEFYQVSFNLKLPFSRFPYLEKLIINESKLVSILKYAKCLPVNIQLISDIINGSPKSLVDDRKVEEAGTIKEIIVEFSIEDSLYNKRFQSTPIEDYMIRKNQNIYFNFASLALSEKCTIIDYSTVFTFEILNNLLNKMSNVPFKNLPPIRLIISKFDAFTDNCDSDQQQLLQAAALQHGLDLVQLVNQDQSHIPNQTEIRIKLQNVNSREILLCLEQ